MNSKLGKYDTSRIFNEYELGQLLDIETYGGWLGGIWLKEVYVTIKNKVDQKNGNCTRTDLDDCLDDLISNLSTDRMHFVFFDLGLQREHLTDHSGDTLDRDERWKYILRELAEDLCLILLEIWDIELTREKMNEVKFYRPVAGYTDHELGKFLAVEVVDGGNFGHFLRSLYTGLYRIIVASHTKLKEGDVEDFLDSFFENEMEEMLWMAFLNMGEPKNISERNYHILDKTEEWKKTLRVAAEQLCEVLLEKWEIKEGTPPEEVVEADTDEVIRITKKNAIRWAETLRILENERWGDINAQQIVSENNRKGNIQRLDDYLKNAGEASYEEIAAIDDVVGELREKYGEKGFLEIRAELMKRQMAEAKREATRPEDTKTEDDFQKNGKFGVERIKQWFSVTDSTNIVTDSIHNKFEELAYRLDSRLPAGLRKTIAISSLHKAMDDALEAVTKAHISVEDEMLTAMDKFNDDKTT